MNDLLCDPSVADVYGSLNSAGFGRSASVNIRTAMQAETEGVSRTANAKMTAVVSWWTSPRATRWVRVVVAAKAEPSPSPLWHVSGGRAFEVTVANDRRLVVACACGEAGTVESTLWMGDRCGGCHDRREEAGPGYVEPGPALYPFSGLVRGIAIGAGRVVIAEGDRVHDVSTRTGVVRHLRPAGRELRAASTRPPACSPDGEVAAVANFHGDAVFVVGRDAVDVLAMPATAGYTRVKPVFSPCGSRLAVGHDGTLRLYERREDGWALTGATDDGTETALGGDGSLLVGTDIGDVRICDPATGRCRDTVSTRLAAPVTLLGAKADGRVIAGVRSMVYVINGRTGRIVAEGPLTKATEVRPVLSPDCLHLAEIVGDDLVFRRTADLSAVGSIALAGVTHIALTDAVAAAGTTAGRVVTFPWRAMLEAKG